MTDEQRLWWRQAKSDLELFERLGQINARPCYQLQALQMAIEKLAKAYGWRNRQPPAATHRVFVAFIRQQNSRPKAEQDRLVAVLKLKSRRQLLSRLTILLQVGREIEGLSPAIANAAGGPNLEYPWPHHAPAFGPASYDFPIWQRLSEPDGKQFLDGIKKLIDGFEQVS